MRERLTSAIRMLEPFSLSLHLEAVLLDIVDISTVPGVSPFITFEEKLMHVHIDLALSIYVVRSIFIDGVCRLLN